MAMNTRLIQRARELQRTGRYTDARAVLDAVLAAEPENEAAWQLRLEMSDTAYDREQALRALIRLQSDNAEWWEQLVELKRSEAPFQQTRHRYRRLYFATAVLAMVVAAVALYFVSHNPLQRDVDRLSAYNQALTRDFQKLDQQLRQVSADYQTLRTNFSQLQADYRTLQAAYQALQSDYANLQTNYRTLQAAHQTLQADYANLQANYGNLQTNYTHLQADYSIAVPPPYIYIQGRAITLTFRLSNGAIRSWLVDFQWLEYDIERGWSKREQLRNDQLKTVILTNAAGAQIAAPDFRVFVDPSPFRDIMLSLYSDVHGDEQAFLYEAWHITRQLTKYVSDTMDVETPRYPFETLLAGGGDCEDTSILLASLLRAAPFNWHVSLVYMDHIHPASAQKFDHVLVQVNTGTRNYYIETTSQDVMEYWGAWIDGQSYEVP